MRSLSRFIIPCLFAAIVISPPSTWSDPADSCLVLVVNTANPDSVLIDTCDLGRPAQQRWYAKRWFGIHFSFHAIAVPPAAPDAVIEVSWREIDGKYSALRDGFARIEDQFGTITLRKRSPEIGDSTHVASNSFLLRFDHVVNVDSALRALKAIQNVEALFMSPPVEPTLMAHDYQSLEPEVNVMSDTPSMWVIVRRAGRFPIAIYDLWGRCVAYLPRERSTDHSQTTRIAVTGFPSGRYFVVHGGRTTSILISR